MTPPRQTISFPDVAIVHKGTPKQLVERDGRKVEIQGKDLNNKFRIHFLPGTDDIRADWHAKHAAEYKKYGEKYTISDGYEVETMRVVVPAPSVWDAWDYGNEIYNAGRRIALADDDHYIMLRSPLSGEYEIRDGKPYRKFTPGDTISYKRGDKEYTLAMKSHGRLRLVLEDLVNAGHLVQVILKTTSYYDCQNIQKQLAGIQVIADSINGGNAGGVPLLLYRSEQEVTWNKSDGGAARVKKWFINIKADPNWVKFAFAQMGKRALSGSTFTDMLLPAPTITGNVNPDTETFESGDEEPQDFDSGDSIDATFRSNPAPAPAQEPAQAAEPTGPVDGIQYDAMGETIVSVVAKRAGITNSEAAKWIGSALKEGRIEKMITVEAAKDFGSHLNV